MLDTSLQKWEKIGLPAIARDWTRRPRRSLPVPHSQELAIPEWCLQWGVPGDCFKRHSNRCVDFCPNAGVDRRGEKKKKKICPVAHSSCLVSECQQGGICLRAARNLHISRQDSMLYKNTRVSRWLHFQWIQDPHSGPAWGTQANFCFPLLRTILSVHTLFPFRSVANFKCPS